MNNANALPIQERLRDGERRFLKWAYKEQYSGPSVLSIPRHPDNVDALLSEAADRIDALEKALRRLVTAEEDGCLCSEMEMATAIDEARAALGEGE